MTDVVAVSRRLAYVLRHRPDSVGVELDPAGWVDVDELLAAMSSHGPRITRDDVEAAMTRIAKQRFELDGERIRAAQGHSVEVDLGLQARVPPAVLHHGTVDRVLPAIRREGLRAMGRTHVHLSADVATARAVGRRRGRPVVLVVDAAGMHDAGRVFRRASNGVWLVDHVPPRWLRELAPPTDAC